MRIASVVSELAADLAALGELGDEETAGAARRLASAMEAPMTARLLEMLGQLAAELGALISDYRVEVRLMGDDAQLLLVPNEPPEAPEEATESGAEARVTLRLSTELKARIEAASRRECVSVNTYIVRALSQHARPGRQARVGQRLSGYGRS
ncbi:MAG: hypothetical protein ACRDZX_10845 [Acidimicrobiales bacterium]